MVWRCTSNRLVAYDAFYVISFGNSDLKRKLYYPILIFVDISCDVRGDKPPIIIKTLLNKLKKSFLVVKQKGLPHPPLVFNNTNVTQSIYQKHLGLILDSKLTFENHVNMVTNKINKTIGLLRKLQNLLPRIALIKIYKAFVRPHLDYGDILYNQAFNLICPFNKN